MAALRYLCLSDLHLGAAYSLLTHIDPDGKVAPDAPGAVLTAFAAALRDTVSRLSDDQLPTLVLMGDVLDMGLSSAGEVARAYLRFVDALFPAGERPVFAKQLICIPGNHDHHLWRMAQDDQLLAQITGRDQDLENDLIKLTPLLATPSLPCRLLTQLMRTRAHLSDAAVNVAYPNLGLLDAAGRRAVVLHHGHYVDALYRVMSRLNAWLSGVDNPPRTVRALESQNGPWIDFLWSDLGSAGAIGRDATTLYETMLDAGAAHTFAETVSDRLLADLGASYGLRAETQLSHGVTLGEVVRGLIDLTAGRAAESQRDGYRTVLTSDEITDLRWYLGGPVAAQFHEEGTKRLPAELSFVFGHTHKPFQDQISVEPYALPVSVFNTGGWVMDQPTMMACQGGAAVFIDDELNLASLRLFNDAVNGEMAPVRADGVGGFRDAANPLLAALRQALQGTNDGWAAFSKATLAAMQMRATLNLDEFFRPKATASVSQP
jgi:hypothetical protein